MELKAQDTSMTDTFDNLFVSISSKKMWDLILYPADRFLCQWWFPRYDHGWRRDPHQFSNYLDQLRQQYLGNIPTTFLASDHLGNHEEAKKEIDAIYQAD